MPDKSQNFTGLIKAGKFFKLLFWLTIVYVPFAIIVHWFYFISRGYLTKGASLMGGIYSSLAYLVIGAVCACLFYGFSQVIKLLMAINARMDKIDNN